MASYEWVSQHNELKQQLVRDLIVNYKLSLRLMKIASCTNISKNLLLEGHEQKVMYVSCFQVQEEWGTTAAAAPAPAAPAPTPSWGGSAQDWSTS